MMRIGVEHEPPGGRERVDRQAARTAGASARRRDGQDLTNDLGEQHRDCSGQRTRHAHRDARRTRPAFLAGGRLVPGPVAKLPLRLPTGRAVLAIPGLRLRSARLQRVEQAADFVFLLQRVEPPIDVVGHQLRFRLADGLAAHHLVLHAIEAGGRDRCRS